MKKKQSKSQGINWLSEEKDIGRPINFLGIGSPKKNKIKQTNNSGFNWLGTQTKPTLKPSPLFKKESIKGKKKLTKWGDADMDGSPNYFDCDPRSPFKDYKVDTKGNRAKVVEVQGPQGTTIKVQSYKPIKSKKGLKSGTYQIEEGVAGNIVREIKKPSRDESREEQANIIAGIKQKAISREISKRIQRQKTIRGIQESINISPTSGFQNIQVGDKAKGKLNELIIRARYRGLKALPGQDIIKEEKEALQKTKSEITRREAELANVDYSKLDEGQKKEYSRAVSDLETEKARTSLTEEKGKKAEDYTAKMKEMANIPGLAGDIAMKRYSVEQKIAEGKKPSKKELLALINAEKKARLIGDIKQEGKLSRDILSRTPIVGGVARLLTGAGLGAGGVVTKESRAKSARIRRMTQVAVSGLLGSSLMKTSFDSEPRGRGRPAGPSGEYKIGGKPVYEEEFQQYSAKQRALNRMLPSETQTQSLNPEYVQYMLEQQKATEGAAMPSETQPQMDQPERTYATRTYATPEEIKESQHRAQELDNPLNAPNFSKGELKNTGSNVLTPIGPQILDAPQVFKGEMRNVQATEERPAVVLSERPQTNPYGSEYLEIEIGSGKPKIRRRITEKFMTGEAL